MDSYNCNAQTTDSRDIAPQLIPQAKNADFSTRQEHSLVENVENQLEIAADIAPQLIAQQPISTEKSTERYEKAMALHRKIITSSKQTVELIMAMGRDLKTINDERLFLELGYSNFKEYCNAYKGISYSYGYSYMRMYERFGKKPIAQFEGYGIGKLIKLASLDDDDVDELLADKNTVTMSDRQFQEKIEEYKRRCEQLTLDLEDERGKNSDIGKTAAEAADLESKLEGMKKQLEAAKREKERSEQRTREIVQEKQNLENEINALKNRPVEVAVQQPTDEQLEQLCAQAREEERQAQETARITAVDAARKQEAAKYAAEIEKLKAENAVLQSNAQPAPAPSGGYKEQIKFLLAEISHAFGSALSIANSIEDSEEQAKYRGALGRALKQLEETLC